MFMYIGWAVGIMRYAELIRSPSDTVQARWHAHKCAIPQHLTSKVSAWQNYCYYYLWQFNCRFAACFCVRVSFGRSLNVMKIFDRFIDHSHTRGSVLKERQGMCCSISWFWDTLSSNKCNSFHFIADYIVCALACGHMYKSILKRLSCRAMPNIARYSLTTFHLRDLVRPNAFFLGFAWSDDKDFRFDKISSSNVCTFLCQINCFLLVAWKIPLYPYRPSSFFNGNSVTCRNP